MYVLCLLCLLCCSVGGVIPYFAHSENGSTSTFPPYSALQFLGYCKVSVAAALYFAECCLCFASLREQVRVSFVKNVPVSKRSQSPLLLDSTLTRSLAASLSQLLAQIYCWLVHNQRLSRCLRRCAVFVCRWLTCAFVCFRRLAVVCAAKLGRLQQRRHDRTNRKRPQTAPRY